MFDQFDTNVILENLHFLIEGMQLTLLLTLAAICGSRKLIHLCSQGAFCFRNADAFRQHGQWEPPCLNRWPEPASPPRERNERSRSGADLFFCAPLCRAALQPLLAESITEVAK